jgi:hypothetical protein
MEDIIAKPIDPSASVRAVDDGSPKAFHPPGQEKKVNPFGQAPPARTPTQPPRPLVRERILGPLSRYPLVKNALVKKPIWRPTLNPASGIEAELAAVRSAWARYRTINRRDAIYGYLQSVFVLVTRWRRLNCAVNNSRAALRLQHHPPQMKPEPFGIVIFCTANPRFADAKTRSKWSRVLRYARKTKPGNQRLTDFIKSNGGLNECARRFAQSR